ncbi:MAG: Nif3-like dinuclear metal center hexameric protein [Clostridiales bacterium]|nr:Nif3-like dinuclear metal center hexameric protein [Clostridiales bacterium]
MFCTVGRLAQIMNDFAPEEWAEPWDNVGLLLGNRDSNVQRLMVTLDVTPDVVQEAIEKEVDMIISHHPLIFNPMKRIVYDNVEGRLIMELISNNIALYCAHTNLDMTIGGVDDSLAKALKLRDVRKLGQEDILQSKPGFGRWGKLEASMRLIDFAHYVSEVLNSPRIEIVGMKKGKENKLIKTVALCAGSGSSFMEQAQRIGADIFITGEIKYHDALMADWLDIDIMAVGHFYSEIPVLKELIKHLQKAVDSLQYKVEIYESEAQESPYTPIVIG